MPARLARTLAVVVVLAGATACSGAPAVCDNPPCRETPLRDVGPVDDAFDAFEAGSVQPDAPRDATPDGSAPSDASDGG
jgi:hypothetical protein